MPAMASPLFLVSGPDLVVAACNSGVIGCFPSLNQRTSEGYESWLVSIRERLADSSAPFAVQFAIHSTNARLAADLAVTVRHRVPILISTLGITREITDAVHSYGGLVFHDAINVRHAKKGLDANVDGIIAVCGGAGGHAGTYNPFAFLGELRPLVRDKALILAGCMGDGRSIAGAIAAGADLAYVGTRFAATVESTGSAPMKQMILDSDITDIEYTAEVDGIGANFLRKTIPARRDGVPSSTSAFDVARDLEPKRWRDIWSAGQGVGSINDTPTVAQLVDRLEIEFNEALDRVTGTRSKTGMSSRHLS